MGGSVVLQTLCKSTLSILAWLTFSSAFIFLVHIVRKKCLSSHARSNLGCESLVDNSVVSWSLGVQILRILFENSSVLVTTKSAWPDLIHELIRGVLKYNVRVADGLLVLLGHLFCWFFVLWLGAWCSCSNNSWVAVFLSQGVILRMQLVWLGR